MFPCFHWHFSRAQIVNEKKNYAVQSKVGSMDNVKHKPAGGDKKVFNDVEYMRQMSDHSAAFSHQSGNNSLTSSRRESGSQVLLKVFFCLKRSRKLLSSVIMND